MEKKKATGILGMISDAMYRAAQHSFFAGVTMSPKQELIDKTTPAYTLVSQQYSENIPQKFHYEIEKVCYSLV